MFISTRHQTQGDSSSDGFGDFSLVDKSQAGLGSWFNATHVGNVFGHDGEVLCDPC